MAFMEKPCSISLSFLGKISSNIYHLLTQRDPLEPTTEAPDFCIFGSYLVIITLDQFKYFFFKKTFYLYQVNKFHVFPIHRFRTSVIISSLFHASILSRLSLIFCFDFCSDIRDSFLPLCFHLILFQRKQRYLGGNCQHILNAIIGLSEIKMYSKTHSQRYFKMTQIDTKHLLSKFPLL